MNFLSRLIIIVVCMPGILIAQSSVYFVPFEAERFANFSDYNARYIFVDPAFTSFATNEDGSGAVSELPGSSIEVNNAYFFPNPFALSSGTELGYELSRDMDIELRIYNMMANEIYRTEYPSGTQGGLGRGTSRNIYNRIRFTQATFGAPLSAGIYFFVMMNDGNVIHKGKFAVRPRS